LLHTQMLRIALANRSMFAYEFDKSIIKYYKFAYYRYIY
jgi:hypothetical protein